MTCNQNPFRFKRSAALVSIGAIALLILAACAPAAQETPPDTLSTSTPAIPVTGETRPPDTQPSVTVSDQAVQAGSVLIQEVVSQGPGWLVIHIQDGGNPGAVIGYAPVQDGLNQSVTVPVDVEQATGTLYAMLHTDAGAQGAYEFPGADAPVMLDGQMVNPSFVVSGLPVQASPAAPTPSVEDDNPDDYGGGRDDTGYEDY